MKYNINEMIREAIDQKIERLDMDEMTREIIDDLIDNYNFEKIMKERYTANLEDAINKEIENAINDTIDEIL